MRVTPSPGAASGSLVSGAGAVRFSFEAIAGHQYSFRVSMDTLPSATIRLLDASGKKLHETFSYQTGSRSLALSHWSATEGTFLFELSSEDGSSGGTYSYQLVDRGLDDAGNTRVSAVSREPSPTPFQGRLDRPLDLDLYRFFAIDKHTYRFTCSLREPWRSEEEVGQWQVALWDSDAELLSVESSFFSPGTISLEYEVPWNQPVFASISSEHPIITPTGFYTCALEDLGLR